MARKSISRRQFLGSATAAAAFFIVPRNVLGGQGNQPPSETLNIAGVGLGVMGSDNLVACVDTNVVALCDVDWDMASITFQRYPKASRYKDYRRMLDTERNIDAVLVATPDHSHAVITAEAMKRGKHVFTQMPLAHDVWEARQLAEIARETGVATQMGNEQYSGPTIRSLCEYIWDDAIGPIREVHCWTDCPQWPQRINRPSDRPPVPADLDWNLWLGPAEERAYHPAYHPYNWRGWRGFCYLFCHFLLLIRPIFTAGSCRFRSLYIVFLDMNGHLEYRIYFVNPTLRFFQNTVLSYPIHTRITITKILSRFYESFF